MAKCACLELSDRQLDSKPRAETALSSSNHHQSEALWDVCNTSIRIRTVSLSEENRARCQEECCYRTARSAQKTLNGMIARLYKGAHGKNIVTREWEREETFQFVVGRAKAGGPA
jgi:hypothetical protein